MTCYQVGWSSVIHGSHACQQTEICLIGLELASSFSLLVSLSEANALLEATKHKHSLLHLLSVSLSSPNVIMDKIFYSCYPDFATAYMGYDSQFVLFFEKYYLTSYCIALKLELYVFTRYLQKQR